MKKKFSLTIIFILATVIVLIGCNIVEPVQHRYAKKLLKEKYNEEFKVLDTWGNGGKSYYALCCPVRDRSILFEGNFAMDRSDFRDEYDQAVFAKEVKKIIQPQLESIFQKCCVYPEIGSRESGLTNSSDITIESFLEATETPDINFLVMINTNQYEKADYKKEYNELSLYMNKMTEIDKCPTMELFFLPEEIYVQCIEYFEEKSEMKGSMLNTISAYQHIGFAYKEGKLTLSESEYEKLRKDW